MCFFLRSLCARALSAPVSMCTRKGCGAGVSSLFVSAETHHCTSARAPHFVIAHCWLHCTQFPNKAFANALKWADTNTKGYSSVVFAWFDSSHAYAVDRVLTAFDSARKYADKIAALRPKDTERWYSAAKKACNDAVLSYVPKFYKHAELLRSRALLSWLFVGFLVGLVAPIVGNELRSPSQGERRVGLERTLIAFCWLAAGSMSYAVTTHFQLPFRVCNMVCAAQNALLFALIVVRFKVARSSDDVTPAAPKVDKVD